MSNDLVTLTTVPSEFEANLLAIVLKDNGIDAFVFAAPSSGMGVSLSGGTVGVPLQVNSNDVTEAKQILASNKRNSVDIDWDELELSGNDFPDVEVHKPAMMSLPAKIACTVTALVLLLGIAMALILTLM